MIFKKQRDNPFEVQISFHKLIEALEDIAASDVDYRAAYAKGLLAEAAKVPELREGITDLQLINTHKDLIRNLLADLFPTALTRNEIKAITIPFHNITFNYSERFRHILNNAGSDFDMEIRDFNNDQFYVMSCCLILNLYYGCNLDITKPFFYDIPDEKGIVKHYRILYNGDFIEVLPKQNSIELTPEDIEQLIDNYDNPELWKQKFPPNSWILRGFGIMTLYDATTESAVSNLKTNLLAQSDGEGEDDLCEDFENIFRSIFKFNDLRLGYTAVDTENNRFMTSPFNNIRSHILLDEKETDCSHFLCHMSFSTLIGEKKYLVIPDVEKLLQESPFKILAEKLLDQDIRSAIFAPVLKNGELLGIIELVSSTKRRLNNVNSHKLDFVLPFLTDTIDRYYSDIQNHIEALIQKEYTTIHPSVYWKFREEAAKHLNDSANFSLHEIVFSGVYPLFGQIDIKGSSEKRNTTTKADILFQLEQLIRIFERLGAEKKLPLFEQKLFELGQYKNHLNEAIKADTEQLILSYIKSDIHTVLQQYISDNAETNAVIAAYFELLDPVMGTVYDARKKYDNTIAIINKKMAAILDKRQLEAQQYYPHYYERFKTDGVEHNLYIGNSITNKPQFDLMYLYNLRLWQLQVMCEMESQYQHLKPSLPYPMDVASLILVINLPITIRFRMDEKRFDVDGSYNARYEVVKKRIDKAFIKGTQERITAKDKITIVYAQQEEELEYKRYIEFLQFKKMIAAEIEYIDIEDLQGVSGLRAMRVRVNYTETNAKLYSYSELLDEIKN